MTRINVAYDEIENAEYHYISSGKVNGVRFVATLGDSEDNEDYLNETFGQYDD